MATKREPGSSEDPEVTLDRINAIGKVADRKELRKKRRSIKTMLHDVKRTLESDAATE